MCDACISVRRDYPNESVRLTPYQANSKCFHGVFSIFQDNPFFCKKQFLFLLTNKIFLFFSCLPAKFSCSTGKNISNFFMTNRKKSGTFLLPFGTGALLFRSRGLLISILHGKELAILARCPVSKKKQFPIVPSCFSVRRMDRFLKNNSRAAAENVPCVPCMKERPRDNLVHSPATGKSSLYGHALFNV